MQPTDQTRFPRVLTACFFPHSESTPLQGASLDYITIFLYDTRKRNNLVDLLTVVCALEIDESTTTL